MKDQIKIFRVKLTVDGVKSDEDKISVLNNAGPPSNIVELRSFLSLCTHLSRFISNFSAKTAHLRELLKKDARYIWTEKQSDAFENLTHELTSESVLAYYDLNKECN